MSIASLNKRASGETLEVEHLLKEALSIRPVGNAHLPNFISS